MSLFSFLVAELAADALVVIGVNAVLWTWVLFMPTRVVRVDSLYLGARGLALPGVVLLTKDAGEDVLRHELVHQQQYRRYSPLGVALFLGVWYGIGFMVGWRRGNGRALFQRLWAANPLERQAMDYPAVDSREHEPGV